MTDTSEMKKTKYYQSFKEEWTKYDLYKGWLLQSTKGEKYAFCSVCNCHISVASGGLSDLKKHAEADKHLKNKENVQGQEGSLVLNNSSDRLDTQVKESVTEHTGYSSKEKRVQHRRQKYCKTWEKDPKFQKWVMPVEGDVYKACCFICKVAFVAEKTVLKRHAASSKHLMKEKQNPQMLEVDLDDDDDDSIQFIEQSTTEVNPCHVSQEKVEEFSSTPLKKMKNLKYSAVKNLPSAVKNLPEQNESFTDLLQKELTRQKLLVQQYKRRLVRQDEYSVYGEHVANNLRLSGRSRAEIVIAQHYIDQICFKLAVGTFSQKPFLNLDNLDTVSPKNNYTTSDFATTEPTSESATTKTSTKSPPQSTSDYLSNFCVDNEEPDIVVDT